MVRRVLTTAAFLAIMPLWFLGAAPLGAQMNGQGGAGILSGRGNGGLQPVLTVTPREIDLGTIGPGEEARGLFYLKNVGAGSLNWSTEGPEGWTRAEQRKISGTLGENPEPVKISLTFLNVSGPGKIQNCALQLNLEGGGQSVAFRREAAVGVFRESIRFSSPSGARTVFFQVRLSDLASKALLDVEPIRIDLGVVRPGEMISRRVHVTNRGKETLKWRAGLPGARGIPGTALKPLGRYISFLNEGARGTGGYPVASQVQEGLELSGPWAEEGGYPATQADLSALRYRFTGTGASLLIRKTPEGAPLSVYLDEQFVTLIDGFAERRERTEILIAEDQPDGPHLLTVLSEGGRVILEGVRIFGKPLLKGPRGWISVSPDSGMTTRETDYVNIALNTGQLAPGLYGEYVFFTSNGGDAAVEVFLEVGAETHPRLLDVYRYVVGSDYLYTTNPQAESSRLQVKGYQSLGLAFRLFSPGTPGTTDFFRWFNPVKGDHFYSSDPVGGGKPLQGYLFEGAIGNIATSRLTGTRELYRWHNPGTGRHFYTTNQAGEGMGKKGYRFDGISGFVR
jgi:hypothetical protein